MTFCPKCGSILVPKKEDDKIVMACSSCGYKEEPKKITEKIEAKKEIEVVDTEFETLPEEEAKCPKCGNNRAYYWTKQMRAGDEPESIFYKCTKCKHTWREK